ncbi:MAG: glycosyltransferase family 4 protein [Lachnospiraceae bacterium]|nr:glycosyltransferase family 4 protein [Lachnospiraceae bacterium]
MNILVVTHGRDPASQVPPFVAFQMEAHAKRGNRVRAIVSMPLGKQDPSGKRCGKSIVREEKNGVEYVYVRYLSASRYGRKHFNAKSFISVLKRHLSDVLRDFEPDVIHAHTVLINGRVGVWLKEKLGVPLVITTHGSDIRLPIELGWGKLLREICDKADAVTANSSVLAKDCRKFGMKGEAIPITLGYDSNAEISKVQRIPKRLIQVCGFVPSKRIDVTLRALRILREEDPAYQLVLIGDGPLMGKIKALSTSLGLSDAVEFMGQQPNAKVLEEMARSVYFVMVSAPEAFGLVYIEAMSQGCLVIGTEGEGVTDVVKDGENGVLLPVDRPDLIAEKIRALEADPVLRERISEAGRNTSSGLTWDRTAETYEELFRKVTA